MQRPTWGSLLFGVVMFAAAPAYGQSPPAAPDTIAVGDWQLAPTLELRTRGEYRRDPVDMGGLGGAGTDTVVKDALVVMERTRVGIGAEHGAIRAQVTLEDARAWGSIPPTATVGSSQPPGIFGAYEAYVELRTSAARPSFLRVGRQAVTWGEGRLVSDADWSPTGRSLDAARGRVSIGTWDFEALGAILQGPRPLGTEFSDTSGPSKGGQELLGVEVAWTIAPLLKIEATGLARLTQSGAFSAGLTPFSVAYSRGNTYVGSLRVAGEGSGWKYGAEGAYELGTVPALPPSGEDRSAYAVAAHVARTFEMLVLSPTLRLGVAYASGDDGSTTYKQFDPILPDVHAWHGMMDVFAWSNVVEASGRLTLVPFTDTTVGVEYRYVQLAQPGGEWLNAYLGSVGNVPNNTKADLGHELDAFVTWQPWPVLDLRAGYSGLLLGDGARTLLSAAQRGELQPNNTYLPPTTSHLAYLQMTLRVP